MIKINKKELKNLILDGITEEELKEYDYSDITDFSSMFAHCLELKSVPLFDTSNGTDFSEMFSNCIKLEEVPLLDTSNGTDFRWMFERCSRLEQVPLLNISNGTYFSWMFDECINLRDLQEEFLYKNIVIKDINSKYLEDKYPEAFI